MENEKERRYFIASIYYLIGNVIGQGTVLLSSVIFTRLMSKEAYGLVNTYSAWVLVLNTFIGLNLFVTVRNAYIDFKTEYNRFSSSILLFSFCSYVFFSVIILVGLKILGLKVDLNVVFLATIQAISLHTINLQMAAWAMENRYKARTMLMILPNILHTVLSVLLILLYTNNQYYGKIIGNVAGLLFFGIAIFVYQFRKEKPIVSIQYWKYAMAIAVPGIMLTLSDLILMQSDRIMLTSLIGASETAVYSLVYNIGSILIALYTAINGSWTPWFYQKAECGHFLDIKKVETIYIKIFTIMTIGMLTISPEIIKVLSPKVYWVGIEYVNLVVLSSYLIFIYSFFTTYLMYLKKPGVIAKNTTFVAVMNLGLNFLFIPVYKAVGAAFATVLSYLVLFILHGLSVQKYDKDVFCTKIMLRGVTCLALYCVVFYFIRDNWIVRYLIVILIIFILLKWLLDIKKSGMP